MKKRTKRTVFWILGILVFIMGSTVIFFSISYSKTREIFSKTVDELIEGTPSGSELFTDADISDLPSSVRKYFTYCGYVGTPKMTNMKISYHDVDFSFSKEQSTIKIDYTQYNFIKKPARVAYIDSSMYGIPFEGLDSYLDGKGSMKGLIAKCFPLFHETGKAMDQASLVNCLSECLLIPSAAIQDYIEWEEINDSHAKATINYYDMTASGIFAFTENGEMLSFTTDDREATSTNGTSEKVRWSIVCKDYAEENGIKKPTVFQAIWHYAEGDFVYFNSKDVRIEFDMAN